MALTLAPEMPRLAELAYRAHWVKKRPLDDIVVVWLEVDGPWRWLVDLLMPGYDWQVWRDQGFRPLARGHQSRAVILDLLDHAPEARDTSRVLRMFQATSEHLPVLVCLQGRSCVIAVTPTSGHSS